MGWMEFEPTTLAMPTRIFYVAGGDDAPGDDGGSTTSCPLIVSGWYLQWYWKIPS